MEVTNFIVDKIVLVCKLFDGKFCLLGKVLIRDSEMGEKYEYEWNRKCGDSKYRENR